MALCRTTCHLSCRREGLHAAVFCRKHQVKCVCFVIACVWLASELMLSERPLSSASVTGRVQMAACCSRLHHHLHPSVPSPAGPPGRSCEDVLKWVAFCGARVEDVGRVWPAVHPTMIWFQWPEKHLVVDESQFTRNNCTALQKVMLFLCIFAWFSQAFSNQDLLKATFLSKWSNTSRWNINLIQRKNFYYSSLQLCFLVFKPKLTEFIHFSENLFYLWIKFVF